MIDTGLENEVRGLLTRGVPRNAQSMQALGYKEMILFLDGVYTMDKAVEEIQKGTRHYAKRQGTFLRRMHDITYIDMADEKAFDHAEQALA